MWNIDSSFAANEEKMLAQRSDYHRDLEHWSNADKKSLDRDFTFRIPLTLYAVHIDRPNYDPYLTKGAVDDHYLDVFATDVGDRIIAHRDANLDKITAVVTNNLSDVNKIPLTSKWIIAHRVAHGMVGDFRTNAAVNYDAYMRETIEGLATLYGVAWPKRGDWLYDMQQDEFITAYGKVLGNHLGSYNSARSGVITNHFEWIVETLAEFIIRGKVAFRIPPHVLGDYDDAETLTATQGELIRLVRTAERRVNSLAEAVIESHIGRLILV